MREAEAFRPPAAQQERPAAACSVPALHQRAERMLLGAGDGPTASGDPPAASSATYGLVLAVKEVVDGLWEEHAAEIKRRCAPSMPKGLIDRQEVFGFVLADALGRPLLPPEEAGKVGQAGDNAVAGALGSGRPPNRRKGKLEKANDAAREALRKARAAAAKDAAQQPAVAAAEEALKAAPEAVYAERVDLKLPDATVGAKRKRASGAAADTEVAAEPPSLLELEARKTAALGAFEAARIAAHAADARHREAERAQERLGPRPDYGAHLAALHAAPDEPARQRIERRWEVECGPFVAAQETEYTLAGEADAADAAHRAAWRAHVHARMQWLEAERESWQDLLEEREEDWHEKEGDWELEVLRMRSEISDLRSLNRLLADALSRVHQGLPLCNDAAVTGRCVVVERNSSVHICEETGWRAAQVAALAAKLDELEYQRSRAQTARLIATTARLKQRVAERARGSHVAWAQNAGVGAL